MKKIILVFLLFTINNTFCQEKGTTLDTNEEIPVAFIDQIPLFPNCEDIDKTKQTTCFQKKLDQHVAINFNTPKKLKKGYKARLIVYFIIDQNGNVDEIEVTGGNSALRKEAVRVFKKLPQLTPGLQRKKPVRCKFTYPISIKIT
ncbi:energy transducer TonB [Flavobacterium sp.]|uniref:energy transducer TonB n=1 Tax=Flavobacterium sp. TaxID=239 RepID=UPI003527495B